MAEQKTINRWLVVVGALLIQVSLGAVYIYGVFKPGLKAQFPDWSPTDLALPSQIVLLCFALGVVIFGRIQDKVGPRLIATLGGLVLGIGLFLASRATSLTTFTMFFGIMGGLGIGAAYVCPIATCVKWFPDKRGLITGLAVAGFGAGALVFTPIAKSIIASKGVMPTFMYLGIIFFVAVVIGAQLMINPPAGYKPAGWNPPAPAAGAPAAAKADYTWNEMLKTPQFWLLWVTYFAGCTAGLMVIMNVTNIWQSFGMLGLFDGSKAVAKPDYDGIVAAAAAAVMVVAILNAAGRIAWGKISDSLGRKKTLMIMFIIAGAAMLVLNWLSTYPLYLCGVSVIGFCFGGFLALYPAVTADYFGTKNVGANYGWMFMAYGAGGLFGPWLAPKLMKITQQIPVEGAKGFDAGNYMTAFVISGVLCILSAVLITVVKPPASK
jgi:OFA family oxalate/formate antiporter-like MFS transporter